ncbi:hypothetical protein ACJMK2_010699 [Sinanodonta woodiana]|uniref:Sequestosome-1 n=1 Tax=Sinanodonta woodiana TaxID=1069815 RepID=A0ABD3VG89_SINWO
MSLTVKAFLQGEGPDEKDIHRFSVPVDVSSSYDYLFQKICDIFPSLQHGRFSLFWRDPEGDHVTLSSDDELLEALEHVQDGVLKVFIHVKPASNPSKDDGNTVHSGIICDGCEGPVVGSRYKCLSCPDYDLCSGCEQRGIHMEHNMIKLTTPMISPIGLLSHLFQANSRSQSSDSTRFCGLNESEEIRKEKDKKPFTPETEEQTKKETNTKDDILKNIGECVSAMLDPFGIDVSYDVEHHGRDEESGNRRHGCRGSNGQGTCQGSNTRPRCPQKHQEQDAYKEPNLSTSGEKKDDGSMDVDMEHRPNPTMVRFSSKLESEQTPPRESVSSEADEWTMLNNSREPRELSSERSVTHTDLEKDPKIAEALQQLIDMGFNNYGGWLSSLLVSVKGDISIALDAMKPHGSAN